MGFPFQLEERGFNCRYYAAPAPFIGHDLSKAHAALLSNNTLGNSHCRQAWLAPECQLTCQDLAIGWRRRSNRVATRRASTRPDVILCHLNKVAVRPSSWNRADRNNRRLMGRRSVRPKQNLV